MRVRVPELGSRAVPQIPELQPERVTLPPALAQQQYQAVVPQVPQGVPTTEQMTEMARAKYGPRNPAFETDTQPTDVVDTAANAFIGDTEATFPAASVNDVPQLTEESTMSDVAQAANNQAAGLNYVEPMQTDTEQGLGYAAVDPSRFAQSQQEQNRQILGAEDLALATAAQRASTLSNIQARLDANNQFNKKNSFNSADITQTVEGRIDEIKDALSTPNPEFTWGYNPETQQVTSPIEEVFRLAPMSDTQEGGFLFSRPGEVGVAEVNNQRLAQEIIPAILSIAGPHAMHSLQLEAKGNAEGSAAASELGNTYHHGVDANQFSHLLKSNIKEYFRNANLGTVSDETSARIAQLALDFYEQNGEIGVAENPDPIDRLKRPYLLESTVLGQRTIKQMYAVGEGLFGGVREGFYTAPALSLIGRLGEFTRTSLGALQKFYNKLMDMKVKRGGLGTTGHELTKIIKGSVAEGTTGVNLATNSAMFQLVMSEAKMDSSDTFEGPKFMWSTHPAAKAFGLTEKDFKVYKQKFKQPRDNAGNFTLAPDEYERRATKHALDEMSDRLSEFASTVAPDLRAGVSIGSNPDTASVLATAMAQNKPLYSRFINSLLNNRFYRTNILYNPEASKFHRNIANFHEQPNLHANLFSYDGGRLLSLQAKIKEYEGNLGADFSDKLYRDFTVPEQSALGMMAIISKLYLDLNPDAQAQLKLGSGASKNLTPLQLIGLYNRSVHNWAITQGELVNRFISGDTTATEDVGNLFNNWESIEEGELGSFFNPLIDAYRISQATPTAPHRVTTTYAMDVTQSGPAITGLLTTFLNEQGGAQTLRSLYTPGWTNNDGTITGEKDLRGLMAQNLPQFIQDALSDNDKTAKVMLIVEAMDKANVLEKFFKFPIMTTVYTRDSGSFASDIDEFFVEQGLTDVVNTVADTYPGGKVQLRKDWASVMKVGLDNTLSTQLTKFMSGLGSYTAMAGKPLTWYMPTGAPLLIASTGLKPNRSNKLLDLFGGSNKIEADKVITSLFSAQGPVQLETGLFEEDIDPTATKGTQWYLNTEQTAWVKHTNPAGSKQAKQAGVSWVHSLDASLVELVYIALNAKAMTEGREMKGIAGKVKTPPIPALTIHDAFMTTPAGLLHYHNAYNNVAIPQLINWMRDDFTKQVEGKLLETRNEFKDDLEKKGSTTIGMFGDNANISSQLDGLWFKFYPTGSPSVDDYRKYFIEKNSNEPDNPNSELTKRAIARYEKYKSDATKTLQQAIKHGYRTPGSGATTKLSPFPTDTTFGEQEKIKLLTDVSERNHRDNYTVEKEDALALFDLVAKDILRLNVFDKDIGTKHKEFLNKLKAGPSAALKFFRQDKASQRYGLNSLKM